MRFFRINPAPIGKVSGFFLSMSLFVVCIAAYIVTAHVRHQDNPQDKVVPTVSEIADGFYRTAFELDRDNERRLVVDTVASSKRFLLAVPILALGVLLGLNMGIFPRVELLFLKFVSFFDKIPALSVLPILFILFGLGEVSEVALIVIGVFPTLALDTYLRAKAVPQEQITKGFTLGASDFEIAYRIVLPQIFPGVLNTFRLSLKPIMLFLIAGESVAAAVGMGYRIFVVRRFMAMDIIISYVLWMSLLLFLGDMAIRFFIKWKYPWYEKE